MDLKTLLGGFLLMASPTALAAERATLQTTDPAVTHVAMDAGHPSAMAVATRSGVHVSMDGGRTWQPTLQLPAGAEIRSLAIHMDKALTVLAGTSQGLMGSFDSGLRWKRLRSAKSTGCQRVTMHRTGAAAAACGAELFVSATGRAWSQVPTPAGADAVDLALDPADPARMYLLTMTGLLTGDAATANWTHLYGHVRAEDEAVEQPNVERGIGETDGVLHHLSAVAVDPTDGKSIYIAGSMGLVASHDSGRTWQAISDAGLPSTGISRLRLRRASPLVVFAATTRTVAALRPQTERWSTLPAPGGTVSDFAVGAEGAWVGTDEGLYYVPLPPGGFAEPPPPTPREVLADFGHEPTIGQVREAAIRYAEVHPDKIRHWRRQAAMKALLPTLSFGIDHDTSQNVHVDEGSFPNFQVLHTKDQDASFDTSITWDLGELIWNDDQTSIDVRSKLMVELRDDILDEVTRAYFDRRRLQAELLINPPTDQAGQMDKELRLEELTARLDGLTGGYLSANTGVHE